MSIVLVLFFYKTHCIYVELNCKKHSNVMDDLRIEWLRNKVYDALDISEPQVFEELLNNDDGEAELAIARFLNQTIISDNQQALIFYKIVQEVEEEVEVECGKCFHVCRKVFFVYSTYFLIWCFFAFSKCFFDYGKCFLNLMFL